MRASCDNPELLQLAAAGHIQDRHDSLPVLVAPPPVRRVGRSDRSESIAARDEELLSARVQRHGRRVPSGGNQAADGSGLVPLLIAVAVLVGLRRLRIGVDDGDGVLRRVGDEQRLSVRARHRLRSFSPL